MRKLLVALPLLLLLALVAPASAHQSSFSYATLRMSEDGRRADYELRLSTNDLFEALGLDEERDATDAEILGGQALLSQYVFARVQLREPTQECQFEATGVQVLEQGARFAQVQGHLQCAKIITVLKVQYDLFFDLDPRHEGLLTVEGELVKFSSPDLTTFRYEPTRALGTSAFGFLRSGIDHVLFGLDHILFLLSLLLVVGLHRSGELLSVRPVGQTLRRTALIVSAFTLGHSLTLIIAALGWLELPGRFVESMIAASIVFVAVENMLRPDPPGRAFIGFGFGLMHGLGFAAMLRPLLPPSETVLPLLVFNLGVEAGQLAIVTVALPLLYLSIRQLGAPRYRRQVLPVLCVALAFMGLVWFVERALEIELLGL